MLTKDRKILRSRFENSFAEVSERIGIGVYDERAKKPIKKPGIGFLIFGVILPAIALWFEVSTRTMAGVLFDPFPSAWHVLLFSFIAISNLIVFLAVRVNLVSFYAITSLMSGFAMGIAILYSLMFATKLPAIGSTFITHPELSFLILLNPLLYAPLLAVAPLFNAGHVITLLGARQKAFFDGDQLKHFGHIVILIMVLSIEAPSTITRIYLSKALNPVNSNNLLFNRYDKDSVNWLRAWGSKEVMLRASYERSGRATDILGSLYEDQHPISVDDARSLFYLVTGEAFNETAIPSSFRSTLKHNGATQDAGGLNKNANDEFDIDTDITGSKVSGFARGLSTADSTITGKVEAFTGIASLDWTCTFDNATYVPREARAQIKLPPGACVSGATIWLDGKKKVAAIQDRSTARNTYVNSVYSEKKDPLLVSMVGPSTVLVQCYPVVKGQITKVDLHIIAPLESAQNDKARLVLPVFGERNFTFQNKNNVKIDCATKFSINDTFVQFDRSPNANASFFNQANPLPKSLIVIVDGSVKMQPYIAEVAQALKNIPVEDIQIIKVLDGAKKYKNKQEAIEDLATTKCTGGQDTSQCVADGLSLAWTTPDPSAVLWIHATQPVMQSNAERFISQVFRRQKNSNCKKYVYDYQVSPGSNSLVENMDLEISASGLREISSTGHPKVDLEQFYTTLRTIDHPTYFEFQEDQNASEDLNILRAYRATMGNFSLYGYQNPTLYLCRTYHFVSPVTSFVAVPDQIPVTLDEEAICYKKEYKAPKVRECKKQDYLGARDMNLKQGYEQELSSAESLTESSVAPSAGRSSQISASGEITDHSNIRMRQNKDRFDMPASAPKGKNAPFGNLSNSVTDKLSSLSQAASDSRYGQSNETGQTVYRNKTKGSNGLSDNLRHIVFAIVLFFGLMIMSVIRSSTLRK